MATKTIIRYVPPNSLIGRRELSPKDFQSLGIFTQKKVLQFNKETNFWLDADAAGVSKEALQWFADSPEFTVETQDVGDDVDPETMRHQEAYAASIGASPAPSPQPVGENKSASETASSASTTTQSTAKKS